MIDYANRARDFIDEVGATVDIEFIGKRIPKHWIGEKSYHNTYNVTVRRHGQEYTYTFYDSIYNTENGKKPNEYDVLSCLTKYDVGSFDDFCYGFGYEPYDEKSYKRIYKLYLGVIDEYNGVERLFGDVIDEFDEICS